MPFQPPPHPSSVLASTLAAIAIALTVASCSHLTPLGPDPAATMPPARHLGSPARPPLTASATARSAHR
jgi:hypothetical protein